MHDRQTVEITSAYQLTNECKNEKMNYSILIPWNINEHFKKNELQINSTNESEKYYIKLKEPDMKDYILN